MDDPPSLQSQATDAVTFEGGEGSELFDHSLGFFAPATVVGSRAFRSRDRVPHPNDIPNRGDVFDDERLERVWWKRVDEIDELRDPTKVVSSFARSAMNVSILSLAFYIYVFSRSLLPFSMQNTLEQIVTVAEYHRQLVQLRQDKALLCEQAERL